MSIRIRHCIVIVCDGCGATPEDEETGSTPHFDHIDEAVAWLGSDPGEDDEHAWLMTSTEHVCPRCRDKRACATVGHDWDEWRSVDMRGIPVQQRWCWRCQEREIAAEVAG